MSPKRLLVVGQHYWPENFRITDICEYLANEQSVNVTVFCGIPNYPKGSFYKNYSYFKNRKQTHNNVNIRRVFEIPRGNNSNFRIFINYISFPIASFFHLPSLCREKYDSIFLYSLSPVFMSITGILLGKIKRTKTTMYVLDLWPENLFSVLNIKNSIFRKVLTFISHWHYKNVDQLVVLSEKMKQHMIAVTGISDNNIVVIPQCCEKIYEEKINCPKLEKRFRGTFNILYAGNISPAQSFNTMAKAAKILFDEGYTNVRWIILGDGMSALDAKDYVKSLKLQSVFFFEGQVPISNVPKYTNIANLLVAGLVKSELLEATIPAKVYSYIASGKPIVLAMEGEVKDLIENKIKCGYVGPPENHVEFARNIKRIYEKDQEQLELLGDNAKNYHSKYLERNKTLKLLFDFIFKIS